MDKAEGATTALDALDKQMADYGAWVRATVLPRARKDFRLPPELYANSLKNVGMDLPPQELMQKAEVAFAELRNEMQALAILVAKEHGFPDSDYRAVIRELKKQQLGKDDVMVWYKEVLGHIEENIRSQHIATLPDRPMEIRLASEAESAAEPAPHMQPPPLINNKGERGTFVLSMGNPQAAGTKADAYDDFTFKAAAWTLTSHEGRPGHELQFSAMVERGVSLARSIFAFNSVNVEGWALYCEAEMKPYEPLDGQLIALQHRLMRATRAFVLPMLNLGLISKERVHDILVNDVCLSEALAREEVDRYTFNAPGQATSYFYGYQNLMELRTTTEVALGSKFNRQAFNDFIVGQGLLPPTCWRRPSRRSSYRANLGNRPPAEAGRAAFHPLNRQKPTGIAVCPGSRILCRPQGSRCSRKPCRNPRAPESRCQTSPRPRMRFLGYPGNRDLALAQREPRCRTSCQVPALQRSKLRGKVLELGPEIGLIWASLLHASKYSGYWEWGAWGIALRPPGRDLGREIHPRASPHPCGLRKGKSCVRKAN